MRQLILEAPRRRIDASTLVIVAAMGLIFGHDATADITERASISSAGVQGNGISGRLSQPVLDTSGDIVAFDSEATTLVPVDVNGMLVDVFVRDRLAGTTVLASVSSAGVQGNNDSAFQSLSGDGRFVAFHSTATNLVAGDTNNAMDVFVHNLQTGATERVSVSSGGAQALGFSFFPSVSGDGRFVAFLSEATNLVPGDTNGTRDVFVRDRLMGTTERISLASDGTPSNNDCGPPDISPDGRFVAFASFATNLAPNDMNGSFDVFIRDRDSSTTERVSVDNSGNEGDGPSGGPVVSADGRFVAFDSNATNLVPNDTNVTKDIFVRDRGTGMTERVNVSNSGQEADSQSGFSLRGGSTTAQMTDDGRFVVYDSSASNLVPGDTNQEQDVFVRDRLSGTTERVSVSSNGIQSADGSTDTAISADGLVVAFISQAWNLVPGDTNRCGRFQTIGQCPDVFTHTRIPCQEGSVNAGAGPVTDVLRVNGATRFVSIAVGARIDVTLDAALAGPDPARYVLWRWLGLPAAPSEISALGERVGCTVNPTPLHAGSTPQPFRCLRGQGMPAVVCRGVSGIAGAPPTAPFAIARPGGFPMAGIFTFQGLLEDDGSAASGVRFSVTNAVITDVR